MCQYRNRGALKETLLLTSNQDTALTSNLLSKITNSLECSICSELMLAPMTTECGHSFCYECLHQWFQNKINCPTCRHEIQTKPALNMKLNEVSKNLAELIIDARLDPNIESFVDRNKEAMAKYESHAKKKRVFGELFCGYSLTLIDNSDGVPRCGNCLWEAHGSVCLHCGSRFRNSDLIRGAGDDDNDDEDVDEFYQDVPAADEEHDDSDDSYVDSHTAEEIIEEMHDNGDEGGHDQHNDSSSNEGEDGATTFRNWYGGGGGALGGGGEGGGVYPRSHIVYISDTDSEFDFNGRIYSDSDDDSPRHMHFGYSNSPAAHVVLHLDGGEDDDDDEVNDDDLIDALAHFQHGISDDEEVDEFRSFHEDHGEEEEDDDDNDEGDDGNEDDVNPHEYYDEYEGGQDNHSDDNADPEDYEEYEEYEDNNDDDGDDDDQNDYEEYSHEDYYDYDDDDFDDGQGSDNSW
ncbi:PSH1 [Candida metapsilosis]|uniref:PSH1 n=1 Tax=Candida metapsilosis TaxID=273372 RepID=A0A8H7ZIV7_9ASCO|nr:PSH1 [Candida metapsilosis]